MKNRKYYDLTLSQQLMYYTLKYSQKKNVVNIGTSLWFHETIDIEILEKSIEEAIKRMDALRLRLTEENKIIKQYLSDEKVQKITIVDYTKLSKEQVKEKFDKETTVAMKWKDCELYKIFIVKLKDNKLALYMKVSHVVMDAWGLTVFVKDLLEIYKALEKNKDLPNPPVEFTSIIEEELRYMNSEKRKLDFEFWKNQFQEKPKFIALNPIDVGTNGKRIALSLKSKVEDFVLEKEKVDKIKSFCKRERLSPQILFLLGAQCYFGILNNSDEVYVYNALSRRSKANYKNAGGMMTNSLFLKLKCPRSLTFIEACENIAEEQFKCFRHGDSPFQDVAMYVAEKFKLGKMTVRRNVAPICFTYQVAKVELEDKIDYDIMYHSNGSSSPGIYLTIMDAMDSGNLTFIFEYNLALANVEIVNKLYKQMIEAINIGIETPNITLEELMNKVEDCMKVGVLN